MTCWCCVQVEAPQKTGMLQGITSHMPSLPSLPNPFKRNSNSAPAETSPPPSRWAWANSWPPPKNPEQMHDNVLVVVGDALHWAAMAMVAVCALPLLVNEGHQFRSLLALHHQHEGFFAVSMFTLSNHCCLLHAACLQCRGRLNTPRLLRQISNVLDNPLTNHVAPPQRSKIHWAWDL